MPERAYEIDRIYVNRSAVLHHNSITVYRIEKFVIPCSLVRFHTVTLHKSVRRIYPHIAVSVDFLILTVPIQSVGEHHFLLYEVFHHNIAECRPGLSSVLIFFVFGIVGSDGSLKQAPFYLAVNGYPTGKKLD